jgi:hypothetical protein
MKLLQAIVFFGLDALAGATLPEGSHRSMAEPEEMSQENKSVRKRSPSQQKKNTPNTYRTRRNKASNGGDNGGGNGDQVFGAADSCMPFEDIPDYVLAGTTLDNPQADTECLVKNACNAGCCRVFNTWMVCDSGSNQNFNTLQVRELMMDYSYNKNPSGCDELL